MKSFLECCLQAGSQMSCYASKRIRSIVKSLSSLRLCVRSGVCGCLSVFPSVGLLACLFIRLPFHLFVCLCQCVYVCAYNYAFCLCVHVGNCVFREGRKGRFKRTELVLQDFIGKNQIYCCTRGNFVIGGDVLPDLNF